LFWALKSQRDKTFEKVIILFMKFRNYDIVGFQRSSKSTVLLIDGSLEQYSALEIAACKSFSI